MAITRSRISASPFRPQRIWTTLGRLVVLTALLAGANPTVVAAGETPATSYAAAPTLPTPDRTADDVGGAAALLRTSDGNEVPGTLFVLMAYRGSQAEARVYDETPYELTDRETHPVSLESNRQAADLVGELMGHEVAMVDFTSPPGGGLSTGLTYTIAYLDLLSDGAFTGDLRVAATGELRSDGYVYPISAIDEKTAAAHLAEVDVLFTPSVPSAATLAAYARRFEGGTPRSRNTGATLEDERRWAEYEAWGADGEAGAMDVIAVRHVGDVAAYLCGAGSEEACQVRSMLGNVVVDHSSGQANGSAATGTVADPLGAAGVGSAVR